MSGWRKVRLNELGTVERGRSRHRPRNDPKLYGGPYPFVQTGDVKAAGLRLTACDQSYSAEGLAQSRLWPAGTLCITIAANIGDTTILGVPACFPDSIVGFTPYPGVADVVFVKYMLDLVKQHFTSISRGATQDNLSLEKLLSQDLSAPDIDEQRRIASILGAYDDLIEVNRRRVAVLEEMARRLFEEWFVRFRFPGHENHKIIDTPDGPLPEGWGHVGLHDVAEVMFGFPFKSKQFSTVPEGARVVRIRDVPDGTTGTWTTEPFDSVRYEVRDGDLLVGMDGIFHTSIWVGGAAALNQRVTRLRPRDQLSSGWLLLSVLPKIKHLEATISGTTVAHLSARHLQLMKVVRAGEAIQSQADKFFAAIDAQTLTLRLASIRLAATRDLLLPRLISGELSVAAAEAELEAAA